MCLQNFDHLSLPPLLCALERRFSVLVCFANICACFNQQLRYASMATVSRKVQWRGAVVIRGVNIALCTKQSLQCTCLSKVGCLMQGSLMFCVANVGVGSSFYEHIYDVDVPVLSTPVEGGATTF